MFGHSNKVFRINNEHIFRKRLLETWRGGVIAPTAQTESFEVGLMMTRLRLLNLI